MRTILMSIAAALFISAPVMASNATTSDHDHDSRHRCIMFGAEKWQKLGLSDEQMSRVKEIQASCEADYKAAKEEGGEAEASVAKHEESLRSVLTPEQYTKWSEWCANKEHKSGMDKGKTVQ